MSTPSITLWRKLANIWGATEYLRSELFSGRDVDRVQRRGVNYTLDIFQEDGLVWITVKPSEEIPGQPESERWADVPAEPEEQNLFRRREDGTVDVGNAYLIANMPQGLDHALFATDQLLDGELLAIMNEEIEARAEELKTQRQWQQRMAALQQDE